MNSVRCRTFLWASLILGALFFSPVTRAWASSGWTVANATAISGQGGTPQAVFAVTLTAAASSSVSVNYNTVDGTALAGTDYTATSGTLTLATGAMSGTITVPVSNTSAGGTFTLDLSSPVNSAVITPTATGTISVYRAPGTTLTPNPAADLVGEPVTLSTSTYFPDGSDTGVEFAVGSLASPSTTLYVEYIESSNELFVENASGTFIGGFAPGANQVITTAAGSLNCAGISVAKSTYGDTWVIHWNLTPTSVLLGTQQVSAVGLDTLAPSLTWQLCGTLTVSAESPPTAVRVQPSSIATLPSTPFEVVTNYSYVGGLENATALQFCLGTLGSPATALYAKYVPSTNLFYLANSSGTYIGGYAPGSTGVITTTLGTLICGNSTVTQNGPNIQIIWEITPTASLDGVQNMSLGISDDQGNSSGWQDLGIWSIFSEAAPTAVSVTPSPLTSQVGTAETLTATYNCLGGQANFRQAELCVGDLSSPATSLYAIYSPAEGLDLDTASGAYTGGAGPGGSQVITTPLGTLNCALTTVTWSGTQVTINWNITPAAPLNGSQSVYLNITDNHFQTSNWHKLGAWSILATPAPVPPSITPNPASSLVEAPAIITSNTGSAGVPRVIGAVGLAVGKLNSPSTTLYAKYTVGPNLLYLANASGTYIGGFAPGSSNVITTPLGSLNCAGTNVATNATGSGVTVNWDLVPSASLSGSQGVYLTFSNVDGTSSPWTNLDTWTISGTELGGQVIQNGVGTAGVTVNLTGTVTASTTTGTNGFYSFSSLPSGSYTIAPATQTGISYVDPSVSFTIPAGQTTYAVVNFTGGTPFTLSGQVQSYANGGTTSGVSGVTVTAAYADPIYGSGFTVTAPTTFADTTVTASDGTYSFTLPEGSYTVSEALTGSPFLAVSPVSENVTANQTLNFPEYQISGTDILNGTLTAGVPIVLSQSGSSSTLSTTTASNGSYDFNLLAPGAYIVTAGSVSGYQDIYTGSNVIDVTLPTTGHSGISPNGAANFSGLRNTPPANDNFANAQAISGTSGSVTGTTVDSSLESGEPNYLGPPYGYDSVWYKYTAPTGVTGVQLTLATSGVGSVQNISVYGGTSFASPDTIGNSSNDSYYFGVHAGSSYYIQIMDQDELSGTLSPPSAFNLSWVAYSPPSNDNFANAQAISGTSGSVTGTDLGATTQTSEPNPYNGGTVWYKYTAPGTGNGILTFSGSGFIEYAYTGTALSNLGLASQLNQSLAPVKTTPGTTYFVQIEDAGNFTLSWTWNQDPANDNFANAQILSGNAGTVSGSTIGATIQASEPNGEDESVWYKFTAPTGSAGGLSLFLSGNTEPAILNVYSGTSITALTGVWVNQTGVIYINTSPGVVYDVQVEDGGVSLGNYGPSNFSLTWLWNAAPANDNFANATVLGTSGTLAGTTLGATQEPGQSGDYKDSVWYTFTPAGTADGFLSFSLPSNPFGERFYVSSGTTYANRFGVNGPPGVYPTTPGTTYYIQVYSVNPGTPGPFTIVWSWNAVSNNDNFANVVPLTGASGTVNGTTVGATAETGEPNAPYDSIWYSYTTPSSPSGTLSLTLGQGQSVNVYTGTSLSNLVQVAGGVQQGTTFATATGTTYYIQVEGPTVATESPFSLGWTWTPNSS